MKDISRRFFLGGTLAVIAAKSFTPTVNAMSNIAKIYADGKHDDSAGLNALFANEPVIFSKEKIALEGHEGVVILGGSFKIDKTIEITKRTKLIIESDFAVLAGDLPDDMPLIFYHPDTSFDPDRLSNRMMLYMKESPRKVPLFQYYHKDPNFKPGTPIINSCDNGRLQQKNIEHPTGRFISDDVLARWDV